MYIKGLFILFIFIAPIIFIVILKLYYIIIPGEEIGQIGDWISFSGGYIGAIITLGGVWWQIKKTNEESLHGKIEGVLKYIDFINDRNKDRLLEKSLSSYLLLTKNSIFKLKENDLIYNYSEEIIDRNIENIFCLNSSKLIMEYYEKIEKYIKTIKKLELNNSVQKMKNIKYFIEKKMEVSEDNLECKNLLNEIVIIELLNELITLIIFDICKYNNFNILARIETRKYRLNALIKENEIKDKINLIDLNKIKDKSILEQHDEIKKILNIKNDYYFNIAGNTLLDDESFGLFDFYSLEKIIIEESKGIVDSYKQVKSAVKKEIYLIKNK